MQTLTTSGGAWALARNAVVALTTLVVMGLASAATEKAADAPKPSTRKDCQECHNDPKTKAENGKSMLVVDADFSRSAHRKLDCAECHTTALEVKHPKAVLGPVKPEVCKECHEDEMKAIAGSSHGRRAKGAKAVKDCMACHDSLHTVLKEGNPASALSPINQIKTCGACHEEVLADYERSEHARALLKSGLTTASPSCSSCHGKHDVHAKDDPAATTHRTRIPETCGKCHTTILREFQESAHGQAQKAGGKKAEDGPVCSSCHAPHLIKRPDSAAVRAEVAGRCGHCHDKVGETFKDSFHGKATALNNRKAAVCADCHTPHANFPAKDPRSSVNPANLAKTCGACHKNVNAAFLTFDPHSDPTDAKRNPWVHWIWFGMTGLLLGVFGFFGLHGLLWLQRALVGKLRGEFKFSHHGTGPYVRRFTGMQMGVHVTIVTSFLLLGATGLPLKFASAPWAPGLMALFGGAEVAGFLHRVAGVVTFGYFAWHLAMVAHAVFIKGERGFFWGPRSMVPQLSDLTGAIGMFKYFLYLGPRPKFDRFTYWEKFDYLAVFWGVAIIGLSGLVLWFPTFFTTFLPGWALNAAYIVHSDEALLATGFIFLFHFFHTHLRPEAFPLDPVIFVGSQPLERFKDERPLEYERAVAENRLEQMLVPPPAAHEVRRAYVFGFIALTIGLILVAFIFWALLGSLMHPH